MSKERWGLDKGLTVALALLVGLVLVVGVDVFGLSDPVQVALQILLQLLLFTQLLEVSTGLGFFSLLGKLSEFAGANMNTLNTYSTNALTHCINDHTLAQMKTYSQQAKAFMS